MVAATAYTVHAAESTARERHAFAAEVVRCLDTTGGFASSQGGTVVASTLQGGGRRGHRIDAEGAAGGHLVAAEVAYALTSHHNRDSDSGQTYIAHTLTGEGFDATEDGTGRSTPIVPTGVPLMEVAAPLTRGSATGEGVNPPGRRLEDDTNLVGQPHMGVRRLTPRECERLQGLPDDWTRWLADGTEQSDSARYRQCGNSVAVPVLEWITRRIAAVDAAREADDAA